MGQHPRSFEAYGFTIEVHAGGRRVRPPSFKRFVNQKLDRGELTVGEVMKTCNVSQSLIYKWRADVRRASTHRTEVREERIFSEVVVEAGEVCADRQTNDSCVVLRRNLVEVCLPASYPVENLIRVIHALDGGR
ncbi:hypothetical protein [Ruegeria sp. HKCCD8929]|uniref:hypothetical protein n=1 Tax=Ruegeria sp. HKCCD8929 TaxID=2683006 RepID=UPI0014886CB5|nr:hypothetical protein [Ruegeria sp. HKCCD8929]